MQNKKVVIYARVSSKEQERDGFSIPAQLKLLKEYALKNGFQIVAEYSDNETAKKAGRTNYNNMLDFLKSNQDIKTLLVEKTDRLYRNFKDYVVLEDYDLEVHLVKEATVISKNSRSHDKFIHGIKVLMAKNYIDNLSEEIAKGLREAIEEGFWPFSPPYGYKRGVKKSLYINDLQALFIHEAFRQFATRRYSIRKLSQKLFEDGFYYTAQRPQISHTVLEGILKNIMYTGKMRFHGIVYQGKHPAIIEKELFDKVQEIFKSTSRSKVRKHFVFSYAGLMKCEKCGYSMTGDLKLGHKYYKCTHTDKTCTHTMYITQEELTIKFRYHLKRIALDTNTYELLKKSLKQSLRDETEHHKSELNRINKEIEQLQKRLVKIYSDKMDEVIDNDIWLALKNEWETELNKLRTEQQIHDRANVNYVEFGLKILDVCKKASLPSKELTEQDIVEILYSCAHSITVLDKSVKLKFKEPFDTIEKLILFTKQSVKEHGFEDFKDCIFDEKDTVPNANKKNPKHRGYKGSICTKWWA